MKEKTVGIITIDKVNNYGAELQSYALQKKLQELGYNAEIIDYLYYIHPNYKKERSSRPVYAKSFPLIKRLKSWLFPKIEAIKSWKHNAESLRRNARFADFHSKNTRFSRLYDRYSALYSQPPQYDVYCVGSDQVWNPYSFTSLNPYFLTFADGKKVKFSYASSFGVSLIPEFAKDYFIRCLNCLDLISVREKTGADIVAELTGKKAVNVVDPTLLLNAETWSSVSSNACAPSHKYILLYVLKEDPYISETALKLSREKELPLLRICRNAYRQDPKNSPILNIMDAGPSEFLGLFKNAEMVLTNSFHGTVFSTIFQKNFYTIISKGKDTNSRQIDLLNRIGIDRIRYSGDAFYEGDEIDWSKVEIRINELRSSSVDFLVTAVNYEK